jgi:hypothetical protein
MYPNDQEKTGPIMRMVNFLVIIASLALVCGSVYAFSDDLMQFADSSSTAVSGGVNLVEKRRFEIPENLAGTS